jgi:hypothetical protein
VNVNWFAFRAPKSKQPEAAQRNLPQQNMAMLQYPSARAASERRAEHLRTSQLMAMSYPPDLSFRMQSDKVVLLISDEKIPKSDYQTKQSIRETMDATPACRRRACTIMAV